MADDLILRGLPLICMRSYFVFLDGSACDSVRSEKMEKKKRNGS